MARPQRLEKLRHGRLLCGSVFRFFVETWNWLTAYVDNMKGDAETDPQSGYITIDRADPDHPVIRFRADKVAAGGGDVNLDDVSTDYNGSTEVQIKDWDTGTPAASTTIAQDIHDGNMTAQGTVAERTTGGVLQYKKPGTLAQLLDSTVNKYSQKILTGLAWNITTHKLVISSANITVANGVITNWADNNDENIDTTPISNLI